ncbi:hypothetical protein SLEP1_g59625, partial [Rubroshorea leprosula]
MVLFDILFKAKFCHT